MPDTNKSSSDTASEAAAVVKQAESHNELHPDGRDKLEELCVNTIRFLAVDGVEKANSGHPGTPMGLADIAFKAAALKGNAESTPTRSSAALEYRPVLASSPSTPLAATRSPCTC